MAFERIVPGTQAWAKYFGNHIARYQFAVDQLKIEAPATILDAACGVGYGSKFMADNLGANVVGVDRSDESLNIARSQFSHPRLKFVQDDCHVLSHAKALAPFDSVVSFETIEHLPRPSEFLKAVFEVLKPGGLFISSTPNGILRRGKPKWDFHEKEYEPGEYHALLEEAGFFESKLLGQQTNRFGRDRAEIRAALTQINSNPFLRLGRTMQRVLRGVKVDTEILPERGEDFEFVPFADRDPEWNDPEVFVFLAISRKPKS